MLNSALCTELSAGLPSIDLCLNVHTHLCTSRTVARIMKCFGLVQWQILAELSDGGKSRNTSQETRMMSELVTSSAKTHKATAVILYTSGRKTIGDLGQSTPSSKNSQLTERPHNYASASPEAE